VFQCMTYTQYESFCVIPIHSMSPHMMLVETMRPRLDKLAAGTSAKGTSG
jgi:hypothetical protein